VHAEIGDMESTEGIIKAALAVAKSESRIVRLPIVFNRNIAFETMNPAKPRHAWVT
jgi:hypothetical protein